MLTALRYLESLAQDPALARLTDAERQALVDQLDVAPELRQALQQGDAQALGRLLGGRERMMCLIIAPGDEPDSTTPDPDTDEPDEQPDGQPTGVPEPDRAPD
jgi:hypothetical protein